MHSYRTAADSNSADNDAVAGDAADSDVEARRVAALTTVRCILRLSKPRGASESAAPKPLEYKNTLNKSLTCIDFVPVFLTTRERYTTRSTPWLKIFV